MMDFMLEAWVALLIERAKLEWILGFGRARRPGERLKLLLACYAGARNTGSDLRVEETIRQIRHILGAERVELSVTTQNFDLTRGYFPGATQVKLPDIFPAFLYRQVRRNDGAIACEGSVVPPHLTIEKRDRKSTRLNSSHGSISYAVFFLKKKTTMT